MRDLSIVEVLNINIVLAHIPDTRAIGRELGKHQRRGFRITAKLEQLAALQINHPIVTTRVTAPDARRVGEDEHALTIAAEIELLNGQRCCRARWHKSLRRNQNRLRAGSRVVTNDTHRASRSGCWLKREIAASIRLPTHLVEPVRFKVESRLDGQQSCVGL